MQHQSKLYLESIILSTVNPRLSVTELIQNSTFLMRCLIEGGVYLRAELIQKQKQSSLERSL